MSWTEDQINRLRNRMSLAKRAGEWLSAPEINLVLGLIQFWRRATMRSGLMGPAEGLPPTIADTRINGISHVYVTCSNGTCYGHSRRIALNDLKLPGGRPVPETATFVDLPNLCRFRCLKCSGRRVSVMADWPSPEKQASRRNEAGRF